MCSTAKDVWEDPNDFKVKGGVKAMGDALGRGVVLVMSLWDDHDARMQWLDGVMPAGSTKEGSMRG